MIQLYKPGTHQHLESCVWLCHIKKDPTQLEKGQEKETRMIKSRRWLMGCEQLSWLGHFSLEKRWLGAGEGDRDVSHGLITVEIDCSVLFMSRKEEQSGWKHIRANQQLVHTTCDWAVQSLYHGMLWVLKAWVQERFMAGTPIETL